MPADVLRRVYSGSGLTLPARVKGLIIQALNYHTSPSRQPLMQGEQTSVRSPQTRILLVGGRRGREVVTEEVVVPPRAARGRGAAPEPEPEEEEGEEEEEEEQVEEEEWELTQDVVAFDVYNHRWRSLTRLPAQLLGHSVCVAGNFLFVLGGESPSGGACSPPADGPLAVVAQVHRYDPRFHVPVSLD